MRLPHFWRKPDDRRDPDLELRLARSKAAQMDAIAAAHREVNKSVTEYRERNHISEQMDDWISTRVPAPRRRMPPRRAS